MLYPIIDTLQKVLLCKHKNVSEKRFQQKINFSGPEKTLCRAKLSGCNYYTSENRACNLKFK